MPGAKANPALQEHLSKVLLEVIQNDSEDALANIEAISLQVPYHHHFSNDDSRLCFCLFALHP